MLGLEIGEIKLIRLSNKYKVIKSVMLITLLSHGDNQLLKSNQADKLTSYMISTNVSLLH